MWRPSYFLRCAKTPPPEQLVNRTTGKLMKKKKFPGNQSTLKPNVYRSLYRSLFREIKILETTPIFKVLFPLSHDLQELLGAKNALYIPNTINYLKEFQRISRSPDVQPDPSLAFKTFNRLHAHNTCMKRHMKRLKERRSSLIPALCLSYLLIPRKYHWAKPYYNVITDISQSNPVVPSHSSRPHLPLFLPKRIKVMVGMVLAAHPLSSVHRDRRVMIITECTPSYTFAVTTDLKCLHSISHYNSMFPDVFWGHECFYGGCNQVEFTMPPTPVITILHTIPPPVSNNFVSNGSSDQMIVHSTETQNDSDSIISSNAHIIETHHEFCTPIISPEFSMSNNKSKQAKDDESGMTLYLSKLPALSYLASLVSNTLRKNLRIYFGNMKYITERLEEEINEGHWIPLRISPSFFGATEPLINDWVRFDHTKDRFLFQAMATSASSSNSSVFLDKDRILSDTASKNHIDSFDNLLSSKQANRTTTDELSESIHMVSAESKMVDKNILPNSMEKHKKEGVDDCLEEVKDISCVSKVSFFSSNSAFSNDEFPSDLFFPSNQTLKTRKILRKQILGAENSSHVIFPDEAPNVSLRDSHWDDLMFCLGGEYRALAGCVNPFMDD